MGRRSFQCPEIQNFCFSALKDPMGFNCYFYKIKPFNPIKVGPSEIR